MKIGILTWYFAMNHGARAHTYALLHTLRECGYDAEIIRYRPWREYIDVEPYWFVSRNIPLMMKRFKYRQYFSRSEKDYKYFSRIVRSAEEIDRLEYDLIILGSDEIFNINHLITSRDYTYFGVGIEKTPKITYAVSCGQSDEDTKWPKEIVDTVKKIKALSVRDKNSCKIIERNTGRIPELVLDPTLLLDFSKLNDPDWKYKNYILIYTFGGVEEYKDEIIQYAHEHKLKIVCVGNDFQWADIRVQYPRQETWYAAFAYASLVITNSFHGTIFAIKNKIPFVNILMADKETKIANLLEQFGMDFKDRLMNRHHRIKECLLKNNDYDLIAKTVTMETEKSKMWLNEEIQRCFQK